MVDLTQLQDRTARRCQDSFDGVHAWSLLDWMACACGALGKAADACRRLQLGEPVNPDAVMAELSTAVIYIAIVSANLQGDLDGAVREEFNRKSQDIGSPIRL